LPTIRPILRSSVAISMCRKIAQAVGDASQRTSRCYGCRQAVKGKEGQPEKSARLRSSPDAASAVIGPQPRPNVDLLKVILQQYGVDSGQGRDRSVFRPTRAADAIRGQEGGCPISPQVRSTARLPQRRSLLRRAMAVSPTFLAIDAAEAIAQNHTIVRGVRNPRRRPLAGHRARPEDEVKTISFLAPHCSSQGCLRGHDCRLYPAIVCHSADG